MLALLLVAGCAGVIGLAASGLQIFDATQDLPLIAATASSWLLFALAAVALRRVRPTRVPAVVLAGVLLMGGAALLGPPNTSTDSARYAWDGIVAGAGISPYAHVPADDALASLRPDWLFPAPAADGSCSGQRIVATTTVPSGRPLCTALNRPHVPTIYPPLAELSFAAVRALVPVDAEYLPFQVAGLAVSLAVTGGLLLALGRLGIDRRWSVVWAWCPLVATEAVTNSHVDVLATALALAASLLAAAAARQGLASGRARWRTVLAGIALGAAIATKLIPLVLAPPLLRRRPVVLLAATVGTVVALYLPSVIASGPAVLGYLPGYLAEEGYDDGSRFALLTLIVPGPVALPLAAVLLAGIAVWSFWRADPERPWLAQLVLLGSILVIVSPRYAWYALLLLPFIALARQWEWLAIPLALNVRLLVASTATTRIALAAAVLVVLAGWLVRRRRTAPALARVS